MRSRLVRSCHDLSEGGLAVAAAEMCIAGRLGLSLTLPSPVGDLLTGEGQGGGLFAETNGCLLVEVRPPDCHTFESQFNELPLTRLGLVTAAPRLNISAHNESILSIPIVDLVSAWNTTN